MKIGTREGTFFVHSKSSENRHAKIPALRTDVLLGVKSVKTKTDKPTSARLQRRLQQIEKLPPKDKRQILQIIDALIAQRKAG